MTHYPMTKEQCMSLNQDLEKIVLSLGEITALLNACYGSKDARVTRAEESLAALQRLLWALERQGQPFLVRNEGRFDAGTSDHANECKGSAVGRFGSKT